MTQTHVYSLETITPEQLQQFETVIGLEVHCQLQTNSKIFARDVNSFGTDPNTNIGVLTLALPGTLPKLNKTVVEYAVKLGLACNSKINQRSIFDRKNYFYPDLPKGYQISQDKSPICIGGEVPITIKSDANRKIRLHHIHLEEDAGKSVHEGSDTDTFLDYNRAGTPLVEIVSEPDIRSAEETGAYVNTIRQVVRYLGISDGNMEEGSLRADVNISLRIKGAPEFGTKVEIKNMNSIRNMMRAIEFEQRRQCAMLLNGETILQETRMFDTETGATYGMRVKETMNDYRYFPDPDLSPVVVSDQWLADIAANIPRLPWQLQHQFVHEYGLPEHDATVLTETAEIAAFFESICRHTANYKSASNWVMGPIKSYLNENGASIADFPIRAATVAQIIGLIDDETISHTVATQKLYPLLLQQPESDPLVLATGNNWIQNRNTNELESLVTEVLDSMADKVAQYKKGKKGLLGLFVGEIMKKSKGTADPKLINQLVINKLS